MARKLTILILSVLLLVSFIGCTPVNDPAESSALTAQLPSKVSSVQSPASSVNNMSELTSVEDRVTIDENGQYRWEPGGGDENDWFYRYHTLKVNYISGSWYDLVDAEEFAAWQEDYDNQPDICPENSYPYLIQFLKDFNFTKETCLKVVAKKEGKSYFLSKEDLDIVFTWDHAKINEAFVSEWALYADGKVYSPQWLLNHTAEDYKAAGITSEKLEETMQTFMGFMGNTHNTYKNIYTKNLDDLKALEK